VFGPYREEIIRTIARSQFPTDLEPKLGRRLNATRTDGQTVTVTVTDVTESSVTLDAAHPLAGEYLTFDVEFVDIL